MQKGSATLFILLGLLVLIASAGGIYYLKGSSFAKISEKQAVSITYNQEVVRYQSSDLQPEPAVQVEPNYSDKGLRFEFNYPKDLTVKKDSEAEFNQRGNGDFRKNFKGYVGHEPGKFLDALVVLDKDQNYEINPLSIWIFDNPDNLTIDGWFNKYWYYPFVWGVFDWTSKGHITPDTEATISGQMAKSKVVSYQPGPPKFLYVSKDGKMYLFRVIGEVGDKILSTFKFLQ